MMKKDERILTYGITVCHYIVMSVLNYICYMYWGIDGVISSSFLWSVSVVYLLFLIAYTFMKKRKSVIIENLALEGALWIIQFILMINGIYEPKSRYDGGWFYGMGFAFTPLLYGVFEGIIIVITAIIIGVIVLSKRINDNRNTF